MFYTKCPKAPRAPPPGVVAWDGNAAEAIRPSGYSSIPLPLPSRPSRANPAPIKRQILTETREDRSWFAAGAFPFSVGGGATTRPAAPCQPAHPRVRPRFDRRNERRCQERAPAPGRRRRRCRRGQGEADVGRTPYRWLSRRSSSPALSPPPPLSLSPSTPPLLPVYSMWMCMRAWFAAWG